MLATLFVLASNTLLRPVVNRINRQPLQEKFSEATCTVYVICQRAKQAEAREEILALLEAASYPVRDVDQHPFGQSDAEIEAKLYATAVEALELDAVMTQIEAVRGVSQAFWSASSEN